MLAPFQREAFEEIKELLTYAYLIDLHGAPGTGKTKLLRELREQVPGWLLHVHDMMDFFDKQDTGQSKEFWFYRKLRQVYKDNRVVYIDDYDLLQQACADMSGGWDMMRKAIANEVLAAGKRFVFVGAPGDDHRSYHVAMPEMSEADRRFLVVAMLGDEQAAGLDLDRILAAAPELNGHQLRKLCDALRARGPSTEAALRLIQHYGMDVGFDPMPGP